MEEVEEDEELEDDEEVKGDEEVKEETGSLGSYRNEE